MDGKTDKIKGILAIIDYGKFQFAAPPRTGVDWFLVAAQLSGLGPGFRRQAHISFPRGPSDLFRVSLVRHPCDWLASCYSSGLGLGLISNSVEFSFSLDLTSWGAFVQSYLVRSPGMVGRLYNRYRADSVMRLEDQPWAFLEFVESIGVEVPIANTVGLLGRRNVSRSVPEWDEKLRLLVMEAEKDVCERYEYC